LKLPEDRRIARHILRPQRPLGCGLSNYPFVAEATRKAARLRAWAYGGRTPRPSAFHYVAFLAKSRASLTADGGLFLAFDPNFQIKTTPLLLGLGLRLLIIGSTIYSLFKVPKIERGREWRSQYGARAIRVTQASETVLKPDYDAIQRAALNDHSLPYRGWGALMRMPKLIAHHESSCEAELCQH
jgi:hypothetical protein